MTTLAQQIDDAWEREKVSPPRLESRDDIPRSYDAITDGWLTEVLCAQHPGAAVTGHVLGPPDDGTNNRRRIHLRYNAAGEAAALPASVFCKATFALANRQMLGHSGGVLCEVTFHRHARALIEIEAPRALFAGYDQQSFASIVIFEDLGESAAFCTESTVTDRQFVEAQLALLARLHGRFYASPELDDALSVLPTWHERFHRLASFHLEESCMAGVEAAETLLPPAIYENRTTIWRATLASVEKAREMPPTLCHGDVHLKNWYRLCDGTIGLADWGVTHRGDWARDLAYTITTALSVEDRRALEGELVASYLGMLAAAGGPRVYFGEAMRRYRLALPSAFAFWTLTLKPDPAFPDMQPPSTARVFIERLGAAMADHEALDIA